MKWRGCNNDFDWNSEVTRGFPTVTSAKMYLERIGKEIRWRTRWLLMSQADKTTRSSCNLTLVYARKTFHSGGRDSLRIIEKCPTSVCSLACWKMITSRPVQTDRAMRKYLRA